VNPASGWHRFGIIRTEYAVVEGSLPGTPKRPLILRIAAKPPRLTEPPKLTLLEV
jgi:large subunit ribosomal protein L3